jgi:hypothetical protein
MAQNVIRVPQGCSTVEKAMALAVIFSERKEYTADDPLKIRLEFNNPWSRASAAYNP